MKLILISFPDFFKGETKIISSLLEKYQFTFHLRKPTASKSDLVRFLKEIPVHLHSKIVIHNEIEIYNQFPLQGIHFSSLEREKSKLLPDSICKSTSCHSLSEVKELNGTYDYLYLSPIFPSISKKGYKGNLNMTEVEEFLLQQRQTGIYALGGIDADKLNELSKYHFDGCAVLGAVWTDDPYQNRNQIESRFLKIYLQLNQPNSYK